MKKLLLFLAVFLLIGTASAQQVRNYGGVQPPIVTPATLCDVAPVIPNPNRAIVYSEGFESTTGNPGTLPTGWTTSGGTWITMSNADVWTSPYGHCGDPFEPHSGTRMMGREWYNSGNYWVFSNGFTLTAGEAYDISFWFSAPGWPAFSENDNFEVRIGQTATAGGMASAHLVYQRIGQNTAPYPYDWTKATGTFYPTTSGTYYLGFHDLNPAQTGLWIIIDDIEVSEAGSAPDPCPAITNLEAEIQGTDVKLTWTAATGTPTGYKVYKDATVLTTTTNTTYLATNLTNGTYQFGVEALYSDGCLPVKVTTTVIMPVALNPVKNLNGNCTDGNLTLTWVEPDPVSSGYQNYLTHSTGTWQGGVGYGTSMLPINLYWAQRWSPNELEALGISTGAEVTKMKFVFSTWDAIPINSGTYKLKIWQGTSSTSAGTEIFSQDVPFSGLIAGDWNEYTLTSPVTIDASLELWIGIHSDVTTGNPGANDNAPTVPDHNLYKIGTGAWTKNTAWGNWMVAGYVISNGATIEVSHYDIYQDNVKFGAAEAPATTFTQSEVGGKHNYCVVAVYDNDSQSKKVCKQVECICEPVTNLNVTYDLSDCASAELTWTLPSPTAKVNIYRNTTDNQIAANYEGESFIDDDFENEGNTWIVKVICANGDESAPAIKNMGICVGIKDNVKTNFSIVPNPATNNILITAANSFHTIEVVSFLGQTVYSQHNDGNTATIDVSNFSNGVYFVRIISDYNTSVKKFVKQ